MSTNNSSITTTASSSTPPLSKKDIPMVSYNTIKEKVKKIGYLTKLGGKGLSKNWRKRFFVLTKDGFLYYYHHRTSSLPVGVLDLAKYTKIYKDSNKKRNFLLINENNPDIRVFHLISETEQEMTEWISDITEFFEDDISDLKSKLQDLKLKKQTDTLKKSALKVKRVEEYELDKLQLVLRGGRLSISVKTGSPDIPCLLSESSGNSNSFLKFLPQANLTSTQTTTTTTTSQSLSSNNNDDNNGMIEGQGFHDDDDDDQDDGDEN